MRNIILLSLIILFGKANAQTPQNPPVIKGGKWCSVIPNKTVEFKEDPSHNFYAEIVDGKDLVFEYVMRADKHPERSDDDYMERIFFSVPKNVSTFYYHDSTLKAAYLLACFCPNRGWYKFSDGYIKGKKINPTTWKVEFDVMTKPDPSKQANAITKKFTANFLLVKPKPSIKKF